MFLSAHFGNNKQFTQLYYETSMGRAFIEHAIRPSCYDCKFKGFPRFGDCTLGDFWSKERNGNLYNKNGTSVIIGNSSKGDELIKMASDRMVLYPTDLAVIIKGNPKLIKSVRYPKNRNKFWEVLKKQDLKVAVLKYCNPSLIEKTTKKIIRRIGIQYDK